MTYQKAIDILTSQGKFHINLGLERVKQALNLINNPQDKLHFIHVAGTNGKGSVCAILSSILHISGLKVGLFTSPHVFEYTERIKINNQEISKEDFAKNIIKITELAKTNDIDLTEFEILTVVAFQYFAEKNVDIVMLETGLGGRLDATNIIKNNICSIITNIDFDHTERLGDTIEKIAFEKAGIIKKNSPVIINNTNLGYETISQIAKQNNSEVIVPYSQINQEFLKLLSLKGDYQEENLALAITAIDVLNKNKFDISNESIKKGLSQTKHTCRFEYIEDYNILIDGAHNPNGTKALRKSLDKYYPNQKLKFIFGCLKNKEYSYMMKNLFSLNDDIYFYQFDNKNACSYAELAKVCEFKSNDFSCYKNDTNTLTVICGSFYMIKELLTKMGIK